MTDGAYPESPCTSVCVIDPKTGWCEGCYRTLDEISRWSAMTLDERWAVLHDLARRQERKPRTNG